MPRPVGATITMVQPEERTPWIAKGKMKRMRRYPIPTSVIIKGKEYRIEHLFIEDGIIYSKDGTVTLCDIFQPRRLYIKEGLQLHI